MVEQVEPVVADLGLRASGRRLDLGGDVRRAMRDAFHESHLLARCTQDVHRLLGSEGEADSDFECDVVELWDTRGRVAAGQSFADQELPW